MTFVTNSTSVLFIIISMHDQKPKRTRVLFDNVGLVGLDFGFEKDWEGQVLMFFLAEADNHVMNETHLRSLFGDLYLIVFFHLFRKVSFGVELHWFNQKTLSVPKTFADLFI